MHMCAGVQVLKSPEKGGRSPEGGIADGCELPEVSPVPLSVTFSYMFLITDEVVLSYSYWLLILYEMSA